MILSLPLLESGFNPRTPAGCDGLMAKSQISAWRFQYTHPCGVRLKKRKYIIDQMNVSIHAPLRGATCVSCNLLSFL